MSLLILSSNFLLALTEYVFISSNRSNNAIKIYYMFLDLLILPLRHVAPMSFHPFEKWRVGLGHLFLKIGRDAAKN